MCLVDETNFKVYNFLRGLVSKVLGCKVRCVFYIKV